MPKHCSCGGQIVHTLEETEKHPEGIETWTCLKCEKKMEGSEEEIAIKAINALIRACNRAAAKRKKEEK